MATDKAALEALYDATDGSNWTTSTNWKTSEPLSEWHGVTTDEDGRVTGLTLAGNELSGEIPAALGGLSSLQNLQLQVNMLSGEIPAALGGLSSLQQLWLHRNQLSGEIPAALGDLSSLQRLYLHNNQLTGEIPDGLRHLSNLTSLNVSGTNVCAPTDAAFQAWLATINFQGSVCTPPGGGGGGGGPRTSAPGAPRNLTAVGGDGEVVLTWDAPASDGGAAITDYEYRIDGRNPWISIGSTNTTHTVTGLVNGTEYTFQVRAVNRIGTGRVPNQAEATPEAPEVLTLDFTHFANGNGTTSDLVFVNVAPQPVRPALYFYDTEGALVSAESVVDVTGDLEVQEDGGLTVLTEMEPLGELTIATHGQGELVSGSVTVVSNAPLGGMLRFDLPGIGEAVVGASPPVSDALFPVRRQEGGITTGVAIHNLEAEPMEVMCELLQEGVLRDAVSLPLEANGQTAWLIDQAFPAADTSDFAGSVRCDAVGGGAVQRRGPGNGPRRPRLHHPAGVSGGSGRRRPGGGPGLCAFRQWRLRAVRVFMSSGTGCRMISLKNFSLSSILLSHSENWSGLRSFHSFHQTPCDRRSRCSPWLRRFLPCRSVARCNQTAASSGCGAWCVRCRRRCCRLPAPA